MSFWKTPTPKAPSSASNFWKAPSKPEQGKASEDFWQAPEIADDQGPRDDFWKQPATDDGLGATAGLEVYGTSASLEFLTERQEQESPYIWEVVIGTDRDLLNNESLSGESELGLFEGEELSKEDLQTRLQEKAAIYSDASVAVDLENATQGSLAFFEFNVAAGVDTVDIGWAFDSLEREAFEEGNSTMNDFAFLLQPGKDPERLAEYNTLVPNAEGGEDFSELPASWQGMFPVEAENGSVRFAVGVVDADDTSYPSVLGIQDLDPSLFVAEEDVFWKTPDVTPATPADDFWLG